METRQSIPIIGKSIWHPVLLLFGSEWVHELPPTILREAKGSPIGA